MLLIHHRFAEVARSCPASIALRSPTRETTYAELLAGAGQLAGALAARLGERARGARVAILASDHATIVTGMLGALGAGAAFAPLDAASTSASTSAGTSAATDERLHRLLAALACDAIVVDAAARPRATHLGDRIPIFELDGSRLADASLPRAAPSPADDPDALCSIYFTSGSTGAPRAIAGRLCGIDHHILWELAFLGADHTVRGSVLHAASYDAYLPDVFVPMIAGGTACAPADRALVLDPSRLCAWLEREQVTLLHCVPSLFRALLACPEAPRLAGLRYVLLAGEVVRPADARAARAVLGDAVRLVNLYGPSEATLVKLHHELTAGDLEGPAVPIGVPMPGVTVHVLDEDNEPCAPGEPGQIAIQSRYGSLGYLDAPELTRAKFLPARDGSGETIYLTGDYGQRRADGRMMFHGRRDRQIKLWGARVDLDEVEAILGSCDGVAEAAVVADDGLSVLRGYVVLADGGDLARVRRQAMQRLSPAMRLGWLTALAEFPRTTSGKIDRRRIAEVAEVAEIAEVAEVAR